MSAYPRFRYQESIMGPEAPDFLDVNKRVLEITDSNNLNYASGQIMLDLNALVSSKEFFDAKSSWISIPITLEAALSGDNLLVWDANFRESQEAASFLSLKNHHASVIAGVSIQCNGQSLESVQAHSTLPVLFKLNKMWTDEDAFVVGPTTGFAKPEQGEAYTARRGDKLYNANVGVVDATPIVPTATPWSSADARQRRCVSLVNNEYTSPLFYKGDNTRRATIYQTSADNKKIRIEYTCNIFLEHIHDLFAKMDLTRGQHLNLVIHTHTPTTYTRQIRRTAGGVYQFVGQGAMTSLFQFCPFNMPYIPNDVNLNGGTNGTTVGIFALNGVNPNQAVENAGTLTVRCSIGHNGEGLGAGYGPGANTYPPSDAIRQCTLNAVMYDLAPEYALKYVSNAAKDLTWESCLIKNDSSLGPIAPGSYVRSNLTNGQSFLRYLLILPYVADQNHPFNQMNSPFSEWGVGSYAPYATIAQLQVTMSGRPLFDRPLDYTAVQYLMEQDGVFALNGNGMDGVRQGLINMKGFQTNQSGLLINLTHRLAASDPLPTAVEVSWKNTSNVPMSYLVFVVFSKTAAFNVVTGQVE